MPLSTSQKSAVSHFVTFTSSDKKIAEKVGRALLASANDEPDRMQIESTMTYLEDLSVSLESITVLIFSDLVSSPTMGEITREGFISGWSQHGATTAAAQEKVLDSLTRQLEKAKLDDHTSSDSLFRRTYKTTFRIALPAGTRAIPLEMAAEYWKLVLGPQTGLEWKSATTPWLDWWLEFLNEKWKKAVNKDLWEQTLRFSQETMKDESLAWWSEEAAWPGVIDDDWPCALGEAASGDVLMKQTILRMSSVGWNHVSHMLNGFAVDPSSVIGAASQLSPRCDHRISKQIPYMNFSSRAFDYPFPAPTKPSSSSTPLAINTPTTTTMSSSAASLSAIPQIIPILSGKGGVGKSSVTVQLALALTLAGHNVGVLDIDLTGPSIPRLFGIETAKITQAPGGWLPVAVHTPTPSPSPSTPATSSTSTTHRKGSLHCMSLGFLLRDRGDAVIWRGPRKTAMVKQLLTDTLWPPATTHLLIDTPPGTSDEHIALLTHLLGLAAPRQTLGAVVVTTPQRVAVADVRKELSFCRTVGLRVRGVVENMAGFVCPCCGETTQIFRALGAGEKEGERAGGGAAMAREWGLRFLGSVPLDGEGWGMLVEEGRRPVYVPQGAVGEEREGQGGGEGPRQRDPGDMADKYTDCRLYPIFDRIAREILEGGGELPTGPGT
ncbi:hypothetical protein FH972_024486 [Carpinus fangiana]|uniref:DCUN1 domain-containing protein n=1 Tax=Carpinus fangiana TaxID=176857 RepID=A0A5N6KYN9_9ROSI|nr:hypothetical protein FH972_024486 [Carpinus fangiana]